MEKEANWVWKSLEHFNQQHMLLIWLHSWQIWYFKCLMMRRCKKKKRDHAYNLGGASTLKKSTMTEGATYLTWRTIIDEGNMKKQHAKKQLDRESTWATHLPLMSKGERILEGQEYCHQWQRGRLLIKVVIDVNMALFVMENYYDVWCCLNVHWS